MAYTKIIPIRHHLQRCVDYTVNPEKTDRDGLQAALTYTQNDGKTEHQMFVSAFNCTAENACTMMQQTKVRWGKDSGRHVLGYHVIQSFSPGEITPELAHQIGCEFAKRVLSDYEVTVSTHLDKNHLHNHIVYNSVSFVNGHMYRDDFRSYYQGIRGQSDRLCREYGLSIIDPRGKGKSYVENRDEQQGKPTMRSLVRADVDAALANAFTWQMFVINLQRMGYTVHWGSNVKYATVRHRESKRSIRLKSLGDGYSELDLRNKLQQQKNLYRNENHFSIAPKRVSARFRGSFPLKPHYTGFIALYYHYVCLFRKARSGHTGCRIHYLLREDLLRFDRYVQQAQFLWEKHIQTTEDLTHYQTDIQEKIDMLKVQRANQYQHRKMLPEGLEKSNVSEKIQQINEQLRSLRKDIRLCNAIVEDANHLREQVVAVERQEIVDLQNSKKKQRYNRER